MIILWGVVTIAVNAPLFMVVYVHGWSDSTARMILSDPSQFLFLIALFPLGTLLTLRAGRLLDGLVEVKDNDIIEAVMHPVLKPGGIRTALAAVLALVIAFVSYVEDGPMVYSLQRSEATEFVRAIDVVMGVVEHSQDVEKAREWIAESRGDKPLPYLPEDAGLDEAVQSELREAVTVIDRWGDTPVEGAVAAAEFVELFMVSFVVAHLLGWCTMLIRIRVVTRRAGAPLRPEDREAAIHIVAATVLFAGWIPLRQYVESEQGLLSSEWMPGLPGPMAALLVAGTIVIGMLFVFSRTSYSLKLSQAAMSSPLLLWGYGFFVDVIQMRKSVGADARPGVLLFWMVVGIVLFLVAYQMVMGSISSEAKNEPVSG